MTRHTRRRVPAVDRRTHGHTAFAVQAAAERAAERDLLIAVLEALDIPAPATVGDAATHDLILAVRAMHARIALESVANGLPGGAEWHARFLRERLADNPPVGYRTWEDEQ